MWKLGDILSVGFFVSFVLVVICGTLYFAGIGENARDYLFSIELVPDQYIGTSSSIDLRSDGSFAESGNLGRWENKKKLAGLSVLNLFYNNGSEKQLCLNFFSDRIMPVSKKCPCKIETLKKEECFNNSLVRKGLLDQISR